MCICFHLINADICPYYNCPIDLKISEIFSLTQNWVDFLFFQVHD